MANWFRHAKAAMHPPKEGGPLETKPPSRFAFITRKRPKHLILPKWTKKDSFQTKDLGTIVPPEELADEASLRRPGQWLKDQIGGVVKDKSIEMIEKSRVSSRRSVSVPDEVIQDFLSEVLNNDEEKKAPPKPAHPKNKPS